MLRSIPIVAPTGRHLLSILAASFLARRNLPSCLRVAHCYYTVSAMVGSSRSSTSTLHRPVQFPTAYLDLSVRFSTLNYSYDHGAVTAILTRQGEVLVAMGARICFSWDAASWHVYPAMRLSDQLYAAADARMHRQGQGTTPDILLGTSPRLHSRFATIGLEPYLSCRHQRR